MNYIFDLADRFEKLAAREFIKRKDFIAALSEYLSVKLSPNEIDEWSRINNILDQYSMYFFEDIWENHDNFILGSLNWNSNLFLSKDIDISNQIKGEDIIFESYYNGFGKIPKLYLVRSEPFEPFEKDISHEFFIADYLKSFNKKPEDITQFIRQNKNKIESIRNMFEYTPKPLGGGVDGLAFDIGKNLVLKIFGDTYSYKKAIEAQNRIWKNPELARTEAMIYDVGKIGDIKGSPVYYWVIEKMELVGSAKWRHVYSPLHELISDIVRHMYVYPDDKLMDLKKKIKKSTTLAVAMNEIREISNMIMDKLINSYANNYITKINNVVKNKNNLTNEWLQLLIEDIVIKYLTGRGDLHMGNIGVTNYGQLKYFDPAIEDYKSTVNI